MADHAWQALLGGLSNPLLNSHTSWEILHLEINDPDLWVQLSEGERTVITHAHNIYRSERDRDVMREWET